MMKSHSGCGNHSENWSESFSASSPRGHRQREDRSLPAGHRRGIGPGQDRYHAGSEISLTPQVTDRFSRFGDQVAILHSGLSDGEKYDEWRKVERGAAQVVVGARSAIFAPLTNIGAIIIDEEHESSYKQDSNPRYHAREVALLRAQYNQAVLVLGSATPSLESRARASRGVYDFQLLSKRANPLAQIPQVEVVDFRDYIGQHEASNFTQSC